MKCIDYRSRFSELAIGLSANSILNVSFDYLLYPFVIYNAGILMGGVIMTLLSFIACLLTIKFYDWSKRDWLGIETVKGLKGYDGGKRIRQITAWALKKSEPIVFLFLSIKFDPFITTIYLRHGANQFNGIDRRDWKIFMGSLLIGNAYWTLACYMGITLVEWVWKVIVI